MNSGESLEMLFASMLGGAAMPVRIVLDPAYRFPDHRWPDPERPAGRPNDGRPTDPVVLAEIEQLVAEFRARHLAANGEAPRWPPGYSEAEIAAAEARLGVRLPEDLRAFYRLIHDDDYESGVAGRFGPVALEQVVEWYGEIDENTFNGQTWLFARDPVVSELRPPGHVRRMSGNDRWVPFATDHAMNFGVVDLDPAPGGRYGQIFAYGRDDTEYIAPSITHLMRTGRGEPRSHPGPELSMSLDGRSLPDLVAAEGDPGRVQRVQLMGVTDVNLRDLAGLPALRSIRVAARPATGEHVGLALPAGAPVELLDVAAGRFEPGQLAGAPDLKFLTLSGNREPVRIAELAAVPGLLRLDLSGADVADLPAISALPALRVLTLNGDQWDSLLRSGWDPRGLAAAELAGSRTDAQEDAFRRAFAPRR